MKLLRLIVIALCFAGVTETYAQSAIEAAVKNLGNDVQASYSERRNPKTKKIYKISEIITLPDDKIAVIKEAFEKERPNATEYSIYPANNTIIITFSNNENERNRYTLSGNSLIREERYFNEE